MRRRELLSLGGTALSVAAAPSLVYAGGASDLSTRTVALFDRRFDAARRFADAASRRGATTRDTKGDVPTLWHEMLRHGALSGLCGMTSYVDMMAVAALAGAHRLRMQVQVAHCVSTDAVSHRLIGGPASGVRLLRLAGDTWPEASWSLLSRQFLSPPKKPTGNAPLSATLWSWAVA